MRIRLERLVLALTVISVLAGMLSGCGQKVGQEETQTQPTNPVTEVQTEAKTEAVTEVVQTETETEEETEAPQLIQSVDYTSKDGSIKITLPDNTWKVTQDVDEMRVFKSDPDATINIVHADNETTIKNQNICSSKEFLDTWLSEQYPEENAYDIQEFVNGSFEDVQTYEYVVKYNTQARMWAYMVTYAIVQGNNENAYVITGTIGEENQTLLDEVKKSVESFRVLNDETLKTVTSEVVSGTTQKTSETVSTNTVSSQEITSLKDYGTTASLVTNDVVNVRMSPGTDADILTSLDKNAKVTVVGETDNWFKVDIQGNTGYIRKDFLVYPSAVTTEQTNTSETAATEAAASNSPEMDTATNYGSSATLYASSDVNIRSGPGTDNAVIGSFGTGNSVTVIGETDSWYIVSVNGSTGYVSKSYLSTNAPAASQSTSETQAAADAGTTTTTDTGTQTEATEAAAATTPTSSTVGGTIVSASADTLTIAGDDGNTYNVYYGGASQDTQDGLYDGVYVEVDVDNSQSSSDTLYATNVKGY